MILDVGCGNHPHGTVNIDVTRAEKQVPNFVLCDAAYLPFRSSCFGEVVSYSVIEHVDKFGLALKEMWRVCTWKGKIFIETEHRLHGLFNFTGDRQSCKTKQRFSRTFFARTFGASNIQKVRLIRGFLGLPQGIELEVIKE
jgi:ubiquinone/menaquinone biosynthesis C-methylase UbiE